MPTLKAKATLDKAEGEKNKFGKVLRTNRYRLDGDIKGTIYVPQKVDSFEIVAKL
ncbi:MAG: hypothetical protein PHI12_13905 [Dehalococcoidales bacterium]|jgi:hypothetical protein|nr:hypothetical protein [Candidatus Thermoplasmatota archaeon]MDD5511884.1 hypothetical protein [Dehalococcoidales bacterium]